MEGARSSRIERQREINNSKKKKGRTLRPTTENLISRLQTKRMKHQYTTKTGKRRQLVTPTPMGKTQGDIAR